MKIKILFISLLSIILTAPNVCGAVETADSTTARSNYFAIGGASLFSSAFSGLMREAYPHDYEIRPFKTKSDKATDYLRFAPALLPWAIKAAGQPTRSGWGRMAVSQAIAGFFTLGIAEGLKEGVRSPRPDGSDERSFPSGHAAIAYMGATMLSHELAWRSPWYSFGAYVFASGIGMERLINSHHMPVDVMTGAAIGILSTELGYLLGDVVFGNRGFDSHYRQPVLTGANVNMSSLSVSNSLFLPLNKIKTGETVISRLPAMSAELRGRLAVSESFGLALEGGLLSTPLLSESKGKKIFIISLSSLSLVLQPYYYRSLSSRFAFSAEAGVGYRYNLPLKADDNAIEVGKNSVLGRALLGVDMRISEHLSVGASAGYEMSSYDLKVSPSVTYNQLYSASKKGIDSSLFISFDTKVRF